MNPSSKALGLALLAALALGAMAAAAQAEVEHPGALTTGTPEGNPVFPVTLHATQVGGEKHALSFTDNNNLKMECPVATFTGRLEQASSTVRLHPTYGSAEQPCVVFGLATTIDTSRCDYEFHIGGTLANEEDYGGSVTLVQSGEAACSITFVAGTCQVVIDGPQTLESITWINMPGGDTGTGKDDVTLKWDVEGIHYTVTNDGFLCPLINGKTTGTEGDYVGNTTLTATDLEGNPVDLFMEMGAITP